MTSTGTRRPISSEPQKVNRGAKSQRRRAERAEAKAAKAQHRAKQKAQQKTARGTAAPTSSGEDTRPAPAGAASALAAAVSALAAAVSRLSHGFLDRLGSLRAKPTGQPDFVPDDAPVLDADPAEIDLRHPPVHPRIAGRRKEVLSDERLRRRRYRIAGLCVAVLLSATAAVGFSPLFDMDHLLVEGVEGDPASEVSEATGLAGGTVLFAVDASDVRNRVEDLPWVSHASVNVVWPDRVEVLVTPRRPVANVAIADAEPAALATSTGEVISYDDVAPLVPFAGGLPVLRVAQADTAADRVADALIALDLFGPSTLGLMGELLVADSGDLVLLVGAGAAEGAEVTIGAAQNLPEKAQAIESVLSGVVETRCLATLDVSVPSRITIERVPGCDLPAPQQAEDR